MNGTDNQKETSTMVTINIGFGTVSVVLNTAIFVVFLRTKEMRHNLFYRLLFSIYLMHAITSLSVCMRNSIFLGIVENRYWCIIAGIGGPFGRIASALQTAIISIDRYQASLAIPKAVLRKRRFKLGIVSVILICAICISTVLVAGLQSKELTCTLNPFDTPIMVLQSGIVAVSITICLVLVEIPFSVLAFLNIRKTCKTVGVNVKFVNVKPRGEGEAETPRINFPPPSVQGNMKLKIQALRIISLIVASHLVTFCAQIGMLIAYRENENKRIIFMPSNMFISVTNCLTDPVICIATVKPFRKALLSSVCHVSCNN